MGLTHWDNLWIPISYHKNINANLAKRCSPPMGLFNDDPHVLCVYTLFNSLVILFLRCLQIDTHQSIVKWPWVWIRTLFKFGVKLYFVWNPLKTKMGLKLYASFQTPMTPCCINALVCATQAGPLGSWTREATMTKKAQMIRLGFEGILELKGAYTRKVLKCEWSDDSNGD